MTEQKDTKIFKMGWKPFIYLKFSWYLGSMARGGFGVCHQSARQERFHKNRYRNGIACLPRICYV